MSSKKTGCPDTRLCDQAERRALTLQPKIEWEFVTLVRIKHGGPSHCLGKRGLML